MKNKMKNKNERIQSQKEKQKEQLKRIKEDIKRTIADGGNITELVAQKDALKNDMNDRY